MMQRFALPALLVGLSLAHSACLFSRHPHPKKTATTHHVAYVPLPIQVGTIALVNEESHFALVDHGNLALPPVGGVLKTYTNSGETPSAELVATNVSRQPFTIADIRKGTPHKGDRVWYLPPELQKPHTLESQAASTPVPQVSTRGPVDQKAE